MPSEVPIASLPSVTPQVAPGVQYGGQVSPAAFGAGIGQAIEGASSEYMRYMIYEDRYKSQEQAQDLRSQASIGRLNLLHDPKGGLLNQNFSNENEMHAAVDAVVQQRKSQMEKLETIANGGSPRLQAHWSTAQREEDFSFQSQLDQWQHQQLTNIRQKTLGDRLDILKSDAGISWSQPAPPVHDATADGGSPGVDGTSDQTRPKADPAAPYANVQSKLAEAKQQIHDTFQNIGRKDESQAYERFASGVHADVISNMLSSGNAQKAQDYFTRFNGEMVRDDRDKFGHAIKSAVFDQQVGAKTATMTVGENGEQRSHEEVASMILADKDLQRDPELKRAVIASVSSNLKLASEAKKEDEDSRYHQAWNMLQDMHNDVGTLKQQMGKQWFDLSPEHQKSLMGQNGKTTVERDGSDTYYKLLDRFNQLKSNPAMQNQIPGFIRDIESSKEAIGNPEDYRRLRSDASAMQGAASKPDDTPLYFKLKDSINEFVNGNRDQQAIKGLIGTIDSNRANLSPKDYGTLRNMCSDHLGKKLRPEDKVGVDMISTDEQMLKDAFQAGGISSDEDKIKFRQVVDRAVAAEGGKEKVKGSRVSQIINDELMNVAVKREPGWLNRAWHLLPLTGDPSQEEMVAKWKTGQVFTVEDLPPGKLEEYIGRLREAGLPADNATVIQAYRRDLSQGK